jgi:hypothetical protein
MIEVGAHIEVIKQRLGHSSIRVTSDVYGWCYRMWTPPSRQFSRTSSLSLADYTRT